ncbi:type II toxin-antitoxin system HicB family antitoxin [Photobacterium iliopiscarium]|uniref:Type II toxin-antitoxin system HicB family antitoxin n=1 Tax=Photobacterium iliopiscarium TaxID=56192 RepID=A0ABX5GLX2_9GAMM|nr:type II toxin-antitoxin system HicB family antitoxin [Photobacterium iliopiscarium]PSW88155.1 type II toxin-antitoxin system HicB family antitoxin [Photobacterium iliopiscarium]
MGNVMKYKGYMGSCNVSFEDGVLHGKIECINDLVTYEASTPTELEAAFQEAVDDYLETCEMLGKEADKTMSGSFNIRVGAKLHKKLYLKAKESDVTLNEMIKSLLTQSLEDTKQLHMHLHVPEHSLGKEYTAELPERGHKDNVLMFERRVH